MRIGPFLRIVTLTAICQMVPDGSLYNRSMRLVPVMLLLTAYLSASGPEPEVLLLQRARVHMAQTLSGLPNYTCLQTVERSQRLSPKRKPAVLDVVRIEVALVNGRELFAWPGSGKFSDTEISDMVRGGAIGNGSFALHAKAVFQGGGAKFTYAGEMLQKDRRAYKWTFIVPAGRSGYTLRVGQNEAIVGYSGAVWIDSVSLDAIRLEIHADDIPSNLKLASASDAVEYARTTIGSEDFLLPKMSELAMVDSIGSESRNRTRFTGCRQYSGESTLVFDDPAPDSGKAEEPLRMLDAPAGMELDLAIDSPVNLKEGAVGDPVTAVLKKPLKLSGEVTLPKGTLVHGRLTHLRKANWGRHSGLAVGLKFFELESRNTHVRFDGSLQSILTASPNYLSRGPLSRALAPDRPENTGIVGNVFLVKDYTQWLERGLRMLWVAEALPPE